MNVTESTIIRTNRLLTAGTWFLIAGVVFYSLMTTTPFVREHTAAGWEKSAPLLGLMVDVAFVMALQADSVLAQLGAKGGMWPLVFRWLTGIASVFLNTWSSIAERDPVGVAVHVIAPALLLAVAEVGPVYRRRMAQALTEAQTRAPGTPQGTGRDTTPSPVSPELSPGVAAVPLPALAEPQVTHEGHRGTAGVPEKSYIWRAPEIRLTDEVAPVRICDAGGLLPIPDVPPRPRLGTEEARAAIEQAWRDSLSVREAARLATRSPAQVQRVYAQLDATRPIDGQTAIDMQEVAA